jgi:hypothetical protein
MTNPLTPGEDGGSYVFLIRNSLSENMDLSFFARASFLEEKDTPEKDLR